MSGLVKAVGKVFKSVAKDLVKIAPFVLAAGAITFTAGSVLGGGIPSWGDAASSLGISTDGDLGKILGGAADGSAEGADALGLPVGETAPIAAVESAPLAGEAADGGAALDTAEAGSDATDAGVAPNTSGIGNVGSSGGPDPSDPNAEAPGNAAAGPDAAGASNGMPSMTKPLAGASAPGGGNGFFGKGGWLNSNQTLAGEVGKGVGAGALGLATASSKNAQEMALQRQKQDFTSGNYRSVGNNGLLRDASGQPTARAGTTVSAAPGAPAQDTVASPGMAQTQKAQQRFDPNAFNGSYQFDPSSGMIKWVTNPSPTGA